MIYFASDFHLGIPDKESSRKRELAICSWLKYVAKDAREIYLLGDLFDFWFEYKTVVPKGFVRFTGTLANLTDRGIKITIFKGNHDMWLFGYLKDECGVEIISDELEIVRNNKRFFLHHGDGLGGTEYGYKIIRGIFRSKICQWLFARIHPNAGIGIALWLSRRSRHSQKGRFDEYQGDSKEHLTVFCRSKMLQQPFDYFIFGHRHLVLNIDLGNGARYINLGDWFQKMPYACFDGKDVHLLDYGDIGQNKTGNGPEFDV